MVDLRFRRKIKLQQQRRRLAAKARAKKGDYKLTYPIGRKFYLNDVELSVLYKTCEGNEIISMATGIQAGLREFMAVDLFIRASLTAAQIHRLDFEHIDFVRNNLKSRTYHRNVRIRPMDPGLAEHLKRYIREMGIERGPLFSLSGRRLQIKAVIAWWHKTVKKAGLKRCSLYTARHTAAVNIYFDTGSLKMAAKARGVSVVEAKKLYLGLKQEDFDTIYHL